MESLETLWYERCLDYTAFAATTVFLYDYALTLPSEITLTWTKWGGWLGKLVFFYTRYSPIIGFPIILFDQFGSKMSSNGCKFIRVGGIFFGLTLSLSTTGIFCLRICTLYHEERRITSFIAVSYFVSAALQTILGAMTFAIIAPITGSADGYCTYLAETIPHMLHRLVAGTYLSMIPCEVIILIATLVHSNRTRALHQLEGGSTSLAILTRLYRDGMAYFVLALVLRLCSALMWLAAPDNLKFSADYIVYALTSIISYRFFLELHESISRGRIIRSGPFTMATADVSALANPNLSPPSIRNTIKKRSHEPEIKR